MALLVGCLMTLVYSRAILRNISSNTNLMDELFDRNYLFEGDIKITRQMILKNYDFKSIPGGEQIIQNYLKLNTNNKKENAHQASVVGSDVILWIRKGVPYRISSKISATMKALILQALRHWEENTCLVFLEVEAEKTMDFIEFINSDSGCYSFVGKRGGRQVINLERRCEDFGIIVHEIGHAIGFWHEQSRPDRGDYIKININNIQNEKLYNFFKRRDFNIDYQGSNYDYGSIMHYNIYAFLRPGCRGLTCTTMSVKNINEYKHQGSPVIGQRVNLSHRDIEQANRLYSCPGKGIKGYLTIHVNQGIFEMDSPLEHGRPCHYVKLIAVDSYGTQYTSRTSIKQYENITKWNQQISFGAREWQFFRISTWHAIDGGTDLQTTVSQTILLKFGNYYDLKNCNKKSCNSYVLFDYFLNSGSIGTLSSSTEAHSICKKVFIISYIIAFSQCL